MCSWEMNYNLRETSKTFLGPFMKSLDPAFVEIAGLSGFDFVILDQEHGPATTTDLTNLIRAAEVSRTASIVRVPGVDAEAISKALDCGASGVQVPNVTDASDIQKVIEAARFPDKGGSRGACRFVRAAEYSKMLGSTYFRYEGNMPLIVIQVEGTEAIDNIEEILTQPGYDILFIGPYDLSKSLGVPGDVEHPKVLAAIEGIVSIAKQSGKCLGIFADTPEAAVRWKNAGVRYISYSVDVGLFMDACQDIVSRIMPDNTVTEIISTA